MTDELETLGTFLTDVKAALAESSWRPALVAADEEYYLRLARSWTTDPKWQVPYRLPDDTALQAIYDAHFPSLGAPINVATVTADLKAAIEGFGNIVQAVDALAAGDWCDIREVTRLLAADGPSMDGRRYLDLLNEEIQQLPNVDPRVAALVLAAELYRTRGQAGQPSLDSLSRFVGLLVYLDFRDQVEVLELLGVTAEDAEGALALLASEAAEAGLFPPAEPDPAPLPLRAGFGPALAAAGPPAWLTRLNQLWAGIDPDSNTFLDWLLKDNRQGGRYIGTNVHLAIAAYYRGMHLPHLFTTPSLKGSKLWTNTTPVLTILGALQTAFSFKASRLTKALAISRPDIFEFGSAHGMPPGYVYEIKPSADGAGLARALAEAEFYTSVLTLCGIPAQRGPRLNQGVNGVVPTVGGWAAFVCPVPGVIVYRYKQATKRRLEERKTVPQFVNVRMQTADWVRTSGQAAQVAEVGLLAAIIALLIEYGWVFVFA
ncbi:hypothetical protein [Streptomyces sp. NPDC005046]